LRYLAAIELGSVARKDFEENCIATVCTAGRAVWNRGSFSAYLRATKYGRWSESRMTG
jgi:hypothetical protein